MAETTFGKVIEFLIGLIILPIIASAISIGLIFFFGLDLTGMKSYITSGILLIIAFSVNKMIGYGYLTSIILSFIARIVIASLLVNYVE